MVVGKRRLTLDGKGYSHPYILDLKKRKAEDSDMSILCDKA